MGDPFRLTDDMKLELAGLGAMLNDTDDTVRESPRGESPLRRTVASADRAGATPGPGGSAPDVGGAALRPQDDPVNHPAHYTRHPSGVECITVVEWMTFNLGNAIKYMWRSDHKGATIQDLEKARWYLDREISRLRGLQ